MKKIKLFTLLLLALITLSSPAPAQGVLLGPGESFDYSFSTLPFISTTTEADTAVSSIFFSGNLLDQGERVQMELFETQVSANPDLTIAQNGPSDFMRVGLGGGFWSDRQGAIRVTMLNGSVELSQLQFEVIQAGQKYGQTVVVPEPGIIGLAILALLSLASATRLIARTPR